MMVKFKLPTLVILISLTLGFRVYKKDMVWNITSSDPYLFVKVCDPDTTFQDTLPSSDPLAGTTLTKETVLNSIFNDINSLDSTFVRIELYPRNPDSPPAQSNFTRARENSRVIDLCNGDPSGPASGGEAKLETKSGKIVGCKIQMDVKAQEDVREWMKTAAHELGHCLGLDHPQEMVHAIMSYFSRKSFMRYMVDDLMGIAFLYPALGVNMKESPTLGLSCGTR